MHPIIPDDIPLFHFNGVPVEERSLRCCTERTPSLQSSNIKESAAGYATGKKPCPI
ncbi:hypothetical protein [Scytonema sp. HK-05]